MFYKKIFTKLKNYHQKKKSVPPEAKTIIDNLIEKKSVALFPLPKLITEELIEENSPKDETEKLRMMFDVARFGIDCYKGYN